MTFGPNKVAQYHQDRGVEFKRRTGKEGQCFDDGTEILGAVRAIHQKVKDGGRVIDEWTVQVINIIEEDMMVVSPTSRKTANHLYHRFKQFIDDPLVADTRPPLVGRSSSKADFVLPSGPSGFSKGQCASKRSLILY